MATFLKLREDQMVTIGFKKKFSSHYDDEFCKIIFLNLESVYLIR